MLFKSRHFFFFFVLLLYFAIHKTKAIDSFERFWVQKVKFYENELLQPNVQTVFAHGILKNKKGPTPFKNKPTVFIAQNQGAVENTKMLTDLMVSDTLQFSIDS